MRKIQYRASCRGHLATVHGILQHMNKREEKLYTSVGKYVQRTKMSNGDHGIITWQSTKVERRSNTVHLDRVDQPVCLITVSDSILLNLDTHSHRKTTAAAKQHMRCNSD
jgi:hypothetical protein